MSLLYPGRITKLEIGLTGVNNVDITNVILMNWERNHDVRPRLFANLKYPQTYQQPHSWIIGSFSVLSDNHDAIYATDVQAAVGAQYAMVPNDDSNVIDFFKVTYEDEDGSERATQFFFAIIYRHNKELLNYDDSVWIYHFLAGYAVDSSQMGIVSSGRNDDSVYVHVDSTDEVTDSFSTVSTQSYGLGIDSDGNLISVDEGNDSIYIHVGVSDVISTSFSSPDSAVRGVCVDGDGNLVSSGNTDDSIFIHVGITSTISTSFSSPDSEPRGIVIDSNGNLISAGQTDQSIFIHVGITNVISTSFSTPGTSPTDITLDENGNLISTDTASGSIYIHVGVTNVISTSFSAPDVNPFGVTYRGL